MGYWLCSGLVVWWVMIAGLSFDCSLYTVTIRCVRYIVACCSDWLFSFWLVLVGLMVVCLVADLADGFAG